MPDRSNHPPWRAVIYNRASADKTGQRVSVDSQDAENRAWCAREGWELAATITDNDRSATRYAVREREGYRQVREGLAGHLWGRVDVLVMWESSRGQRRLEGYVELRELCAQHGVRLAYKGRVYDMREGDDRFTTGLDALLDEREAERARDRTLRSHQASVAARKPRGVTPFGYKRTYASGSNHMLTQEPDPGTAPIVQGIVADVLGGASLYSIAKRLNADGVLTPRGRDGAWTSSMIRNLLRKPSLAGIRTHNGAVVGPGTWTPVVDPADWRAVQALLSDPGRVAHHGGRDVAWLLSGIARCGVCSAWLRPMRNAGRMTYACAGLTPTAPKGHVSRGAAALDAYVTAHVVRQLADPALGRAIAERGREAQEVQDTDAVELAGLEARMAAQVQSLKVASGAAAAAFQDVVLDLGAQIDRVQARMRRIAPHPPVVAELAGPDAAESWNSPRVQGDIELQRRVVRALLRVVVHPVGRRGVRGFDPSTVEVTPV